MNIWANGEGRGRSLVRERRGLAEVLLCVDCMCFTPKRLLNEAKFTVIRTYFFKGPTSFIFFNKSRCISQKPFSIVSIK